MMGSTEMDGKNGDGGNHAKDATSADCQSSHKGSHSLQLPES
jgi:hypothetical protein